jgi:hypothetical protein
MKVLFRLHVSVAVDPDEHPISHLEHIRRKVLTGLYEDSIHTVEVLFVTIKVEFNAFPLSSMNTRSPTVTASSGKGARRRPLIHSRILHILRTLLFIMKR